MSMRGTIVALATRGKLTDAPTTANVKSGIKYSAGWLTGTYTPSGGGETDPPTGTGPLLSTLLTADLGAILAAGSGAGEALTYRRESDDGAGTLVFERSIRGMVRVREKLHQNEDDGEIEITFATVTILANDTSGVSEPNIDTDYITRSDGSIWSVQEVLSRNQGQALLRCELFDHLRKSAGEVETDR